MDDEEIKKGLELVRLVAWGMSKKLPSYLEIPDLISAGNLGLARAIRTFDPEKGVPFGAYATLKIRGAIIEDLREKDPLTRNQRKDSQAIGAFVEDTTREGFPTPSPEEISTALGISIKSVEFLLVNPGKNIYLNDHLNSDGESLLESVFLRSQDLGEDLIKAEAARCVRGILGSLPKSDRKVLTEYFLKGKVYREMGEDRGVTETRAYQMVKASLKKARRVARRVYWDLEED